MEKNRVWFGAGEGEVSCQIRYSFQHQHNHIHIRTHVLLGERQFSYLNVKAICERWNNLIITEQNALFISYYIGWIKWNGMRSG